MNNRFPAYEKLFGSIDFRKSDEARSVYSPAAYLADLLQLIDDHFASTDELDTRRNDLKEKIDLDAKNTFELHPYLDIVNDLLEDKVSADDPYGVLRSAIYPLNLPFNLDAHKIELYQKYLGISPLELYHAFALKEDPQIIARLYLGLNAEQESEILLTLAELEDIDNGLEERFGNQIENLGSSAKQPLHAILQGMQISFENLVTLIEANLGESAIAAGHQAHLFTNHNLGGYVSFDTDRTQLKWVPDQGTEGSGSIPKAWYARILKLARLSNTTGITPVDLNTILANCCDYTLDKVGLQRIALIKYLSQEWSLDIGEACLLLTQRAHLGSQTQFALKEQLHQTFNAGNMSFAQTVIGNKQSWRKKDEKGRVDNRPRITPEGDLLKLENKPYRIRVASGLGIAEKALVEIITGFRNQINQTLESKTEHNRLWDTNFWQSEFDREEASMLAALYRIVKLAERLECSHVDIFNMLEIISHDPAIDLFSLKNDFIAQPILEKDLYSILRAGSTADLLGVTQLLTGLWKWLLESDISTPELLKITSNRFAKSLKASNPNETEQKPSRETAARREKLAVLNALYSQVKPWLLGGDSFRDSRIDNRFSRLIYFELLKSDLVSKVDRRLLVSAEPNEKTLTDFVNHVVGQLPIITRNDFLGLGIEEKFANKFFDNLVLRGVLNDEGVLIADKLGKSGEEFKIESDFNSFKEELFAKISSINENFIDPAVFLSDLEFLDLTSKELYELYDNLIFNQYLAQDGTILQPLLFESKEFLDRFEVNSDISSYQIQVYELLKKRIDQFNAAKIVVSPELFGDLNFEPAELTALINNLHFNEYIDENQVLSDPHSLLKLNPNEMLLELRFYPQRKEILSALQNLINKVQADYYQMTRDSFYDIAEQLIADWSFETVSKTLLINGRLEPADSAYFRDQENSPNFDIAWPFEPYHNQVVFDRLRGIIQDADKYRLTNTHFEGFNFSELEIEEVISVLINFGHINVDRMVTRNKLPYFLNINNALNFNVDAFEDYSKDIFFALHSLAKQTQQMAETIMSIFKELAHGQQNSLYPPLQDGFGLPGLLIKAISDEIYADAGSVADVWIAPLLSAVNILDTIDQEPTSSTFNLAYRRIQQFAHFASKFGFSPEEVRIAFNDQSLVEKFPTGLVLPEITMEDGQKVRLTSIDALLESKDGRIYIFKSANKALGLRSAQYWAYDAATLELIETKDQMVSTLLTGDEEQTVNVFRINAAFVNKSGQDVIIADGRYFVREESDSGTVWQTQNREWGHTQSDFEDPSEIDSAFKDESGRVYLFSNDQYIRYSTGIRLVDNGYPKNIADSWSSEGKNQLLPESFQSSINGAFHGEDDETYFFKGDKFIASDDFSSIRPTTEMWGKVKNNLAETQQVDAFYVDSNLLYLFSGDQIFAFRDSIENDGVLVQEGFPQTLADFFGTRLPGQFHNGVDAAFKGEDKLIHLFKGSESITIRPTAGNNSTPRAMEKLKDKWGIVKNNLAQTGEVDAAMAGLDGRVYIFSGEQYYRYSSSDYTEADDGYPRSTAEDWGGLSQINAAFILNGKTYLFGTGFVTHPTKEPAFTKAYIRYSTNSYEKPDEGYPKVQAETDAFWWNFPEKLVDDERFEEIDAAFNAPDGKIYLFAGPLYIVFDHLQNWWSEPLEISQKWDRLPFNTIDAAFYGKDGRAYFFSGDEYARFSDEEFVELDNGYPRHTKRLWGNIKNNIVEQKRIDAALVLESREKKKKEVDLFPINPPAGDREDNEIIVKTMHTYLFSGNQFFRYAGSSYDFVEPGYPRKLSALKNEPRFNNVDIDLTKAIDAAFADERSVYLLQGSMIHVVSEESNAVYRSSNSVSIRRGIKGLTNAILSEGGIYIEKDDAWFHVTPIENKRLTLTEESPAFSIELPDRFRKDLDAVLYGVDNNIYFFKGKRFYNSDLNREYAIKEYWGNVRSNFREDNHVDAAFVGRDGRTYLFSGDQFVVYGGDQVDLERDPYIGQEVDTDPELEHSIRSIAEHWGGLNEVDLAYVLGDETYLFEKRDGHGQRRYIKFSTEDYGKPDSPPMVASINHWEMAHEYTSDGWLDFDTIFAIDDDTLIFIKGKMFLQLDVPTKTWTNPRRLDMLWPGTQLENFVLDQFETILVTSDHRAYFFGNGAYLSYMQSEGLSERKLISKDWALLPTYFDDKIDAAFVHGGHYTYLFSGNRYVRYSGDHYQFVDAGYPKMIANHLRDEPGFKSLPKEFESMVTTLDTGVGATIIRGVINNGRNIYIFTEDHCYVSSTGLTASYDLSILGRQRNNLLTTGEIDAALVTADGMTYLFSGDQYLRYSEHPYQYVDAGYPKRIATGLAAEFGVNPAKMAPFASGIDAAISVTSRNGKDEEICLFKDKTFINLKDGTGGLIKGNWGNVQNNFDPDAESQIIDGAFVDAHGRLYVFKGDQYVRYADTEAIYGETGYPKQIVSTFDLPKSFEREIDAAFTFAGGTYLVNGESYVRFAEDEYDVPPDFYPVTFAGGWGDWADYRLSDLQIIAKFKKLQMTYTGEATLTDGLNINQFDIHDPYSMLADIFDWDIEEIKWLKRNNCFLPHTIAIEEQRFNLELILRLYEILSLTERMAGDAKSIQEEVWLSLYDTINLTSAAQKLHRLLGVKHSGSPDWEILEAEIHNKLNLLKRNVLVTYVIFKNDNIADSRDLYEHLLIDAQMGHEAKTSRIKEAISAVQLYLHRYFINLEGGTLRVDGDNGSDIDSKSLIIGPESREVLKQRWNWMRSYRVWEANRKVFLYPENYIRPELRDTKTPEFKTLEENLLQGELTEANITRALHSYIDKYIEISRLTIAGGYVYDSVKGNGDKEVILFGRTKSEPQRYYYRMAAFIKGQSNTIQWKPWLEVNTQIDADQVYPVYALNKIFVFWAKVELRSSVDGSSGLTLKQDGDSISAQTDVVNESVLQVYYSYFNLNGEWAPQQKIKYEITSNDTITDFVLDLSGNREAADIDLDHIQINCHYITERHLRPKGNSDGQVIDGALGALDKQVVHLKVTNQDRPYFVNGGSFGGQATAYLMLPGDQLTEGTRFRIVRIEKPGYVRFESADQPNYFVKRTGNNEFDMSRDDGSTAFREASTFPIQKISSGYQVVLDRKAGTFQSFTDQITVDQFHSIKNILGWNLAELAKLGVFPAVFTGYDQVFTLQKGILGEGTQVMMRTVKDPEKVKIEAITGDPRVGGVYQGTGNYLTVNNSNQIGLTRRSDSLFVITKGMIGDGYALKPFKGNRNVFVYLEEDSNAPAGRESHALLMKHAAWDQIPTNAAKRQTTFNFVTNRQEEANLFNFFPETNLAKEATISSFTFDPTLELDTFKDLFPAEDHKVVENSVSLNRPTGDLAMPWVCFDYKGGSFMCKPTSGVSDGSANSRLLSEDAIQRPDGFGLPDAAVHAGGITHLFSQSGNYAQEGDTASQPITELWGKVINHIQTDNRIDAALSIPTSPGQFKTFLFRKEQVVRYSNLDGTFVDESYPKSLATNSDDELPDVIKNWEKIDAAFRVRNTVYFVNGVNYVTVTGVRVSDALTVFGDLWSQWRTANHVDGVLELNESFYIHHEQLNRWFHADNVQDIEKAIDHFYRLVSVDELRHRKNSIESLFLLDNMVYITFRVADDLVDRHVKIRQNRFDNPFNRIRGTNVSGFDGLLLSNDTLYFLEHEAMESGSEELPRLTPFDLLEDGFENPIHITGAPNDTIDRIYLFEGDTYLFSNDETMKISGGPITAMVTDPSTGERSITWEKNGDIDEFVGRLEHKPLIKTIDAAFNTGTHVFFFAGDQYIRANITGSDNPDDSGRFMPDEGYPKLISAGGLDNLPAWDRIDAAFEGPPGLINYFGDGKYTHNFMPEGEGEPDLKDRWGRVRNNIQSTGSVEAAFTMNGNVYQISGDQYYRYRGTDLNPPILEEGYPKRLANNTEGLPKEDLGPVGYGFEMGDKVYLFYPARGRYVEVNPATQLNEKSRSANGWQFNRAAFIRHSEDGSELVVFGPSGITVFENPTPDIFNPTYDIIRLSSMTGSQLSKALFVNGIDGLMRIVTQAIDELPKFEFSDSNINSNGNALIFVDRRDVSEAHFPVDSHLEFNGANGLYYWEIFYHAPSLIAQALNAAQKFEQAKRWYEYIFDPTQKGAYWKFLPFMAIDAQSIINALAYWKSDTFPTLKSAVMELETEIRKFGPHLLGINAQKYKALALLHDEMDDHINDIPDQLRDEHWTALTVQATTINNELVKLQPDQVDDAQVAETKEMLALLEQLKARYTVMLEGHDLQIKAYLDDPFDPHAIAAIRQIAYRRATVMAYIDNLLDWGDMLFRQYTHESINEARMLYVLAYDLLGKKPIDLGEKPVSQAVTYSRLADKGAELINVEYDFLFDIALDEVEARSLTPAGQAHRSVGSPYFNIPENDLILGYWDRVEDRLYKIRHSLNILGIKEPLPLFQPPIDPMALVQSVAGGAFGAGAFSPSKIKVPHYRFSFLLQKARDLASRVSQFGNELLGALEKKDAETLSLLQNRQEGVILDMTLAVREAQLRESEESLKQFEISLSGAELQKDHYANLISAGMLPEEQTQIDLMTGAGITFALVPIVKILAAIAKALPDIKVGSPFSMGATLGGSTIGAALGFLAESGEMIAESMSMFGEVSGMVAQHKRSVEDWELQLKMAQSEMDQLNRQIEGAKWQIKGAQQELAISNKEIEHRQAVYTFMTEKFSNEQLYQWMAGRLSSLYFETFKMAFDMAKAAEMAFRFERAFPDQQVNYINGTYWDSLHRGLTAGDTLALDLDRMEKAYLESDSRAFEITKTIPLAEIDPIAFLTLKSKGVCEFNLTEALFAYDFPSHFCRQIKTVAVKLVAGEGETVNATLTQLSNKVTLEPDLKAVKYLLDPQGDPPTTIRSDWHSTQQIAVTEVDQYTGLSNGLFELYFGDDRYLPFEGTGAVSSWRLELNGKRGSFNPGALSTVEIELKYTAWQGGKAFGDAVKGMLKPYETAVYIDMATRLPNEFFAWVYGETEDLEMIVTRDMFPNMAGSKILAVYSYFETKENGQISVVMNEDSALTLRNKKLLVTNALAVGSRGEKWRFAAKGKKLDLENMGLVFVYKAHV